MTDVVTAATHGLDVRLSEAARQALARRGQPLCVQLELLFSCMLRKQVHFPQIQHPDALALDAGSPSLRVWFRAVGTKTCLISDQPVPDLQTFPLRRTEPFKPRWLALDYRDGRWSGQFGYADPAHA